MPVEFRVEDVRGRFLFGRPAKAMQWATTTAELRANVKRTADALEKSDDGKSLWELHVILIRHDGGFAEQLLRIDPEAREVNESYVDLVMTELLKIMWRLRDCNRYLPPRGDDSQAPEVGED